MARLCRMCLEISYETTSIYGTYEVEELQETQSITIIDILHSFLTLKFDPSDGLPSDICVSCLEDSIKMYIFKKKCENSNDILRSQCNLIDRLRSNDIDGFITENSRDSLLDSDDLYNSRSKRVKKDDKANSTMVVMKSEYNDKDSRKIYSCNYCKFFAVSMMEYVKHVKEKHATKSSHIEIDEKFLEHCQSFTEDTENGIDLYRCRFDSKCDYKTQFKSNIVLHLRSHVIHYT